MFGNAIASNRNTDNTVLPKECPLMNKRVTIILFIAFVIATGSTVLVYRLVARRIAGPAHTTTQVVTVTRDIPLGSILHDEDVAMMDVVGPPPKGALLKKEDALNRGVISELYQGEPVLDARLAPAGSGGGLAATIPQGMRACAIRVDEVVGVAGFVTPGERVDVLITGNPPGTDDPTAGPRVRTLLQDIQVLSAGTDIQRDAEGKAHPVQVVNLLVDPAQAEDLSLAGNQTRIQLVLRNPLDNQIATPPGTAMAKLFDDAKPAPKPVVHAVVAKAPAPPRVFLVQVLNGSKRSEEKFNATDEAK